MGTKPFRPVAALAALLLLSACGGAMRWQKADADDTTLEVDLSACRKQAQAMYGISSPPMGTVDPRFGPVGPSPAENAMLQSQAIGGCMRGKGYALVPDGK